MRTSFATLALASVAVLAAPFASAQQAPTHVTVAVGPGNQTPWIGGNVAQPQVLVGSNGQTYIGLWIDAPDANNQQSQVRRAPLDIALLIDNSGSMSGEKIANARLAATSMLETLADGDIASVAVFSQGVRPLAGPVVIDRETRGMLIGMVQGIVPEGGTNMYAGLQYAEAMLQEGPASHPVRRIVMVSDGMANIGPSSPQELGDLAARGTEQNIQVSAIGVGNEYDEHTLSALAVRTSGRLYHLADPSGMAAILRDETQMLARTVAADAYLEMVPAPGVQILGSDVAPGTFVNGAYRIPIGSLAARQHRELLVRATIDTSVAGDHPVGTARFVFRDPGHANALQTQNVPLHYQVVRDARVASSSRDSHVVAMEVSHDAARAQLQAVDMLNQGRAREAAATLAQAEASVRRAAATSDHDVAMRLGAQAGGLARGQASAVSAASAPAAAPAARAAALDNNSAAFHSLGY